MDISNVSWNVYPQNPVNSIPKSKDLSFRIISRIGSASMNGRIYEAEQKTNEKERVALKFMLKENIEECYLASRLGEKHPIFFPRVLGWKYDNVIVREETKEHSDIFLENAEISYIKNFVLQNMKCDKRLRIMMKKMNSKGEILMQDLKDLGVPHSVLKEVNTDGKIEMLLMASELLSGDLVSFIKSNPKHKEIPRLVSEVFGGLRVLVSERIVHEDLHLGNVLLRSDSNGHITSVIHDFGESTLDRSPYEHMRDVNTFLHALITSVGTQYEDIIQSCQRLIDSVDVSSTRDDVIDVLIKIQELFMGAIEII